MPLHNTPDSPATTNDVEKATGGVAELTHTTSYGLPGHECGAVPQALSNDDDAEHCAFPNEKQDAGLTKVVSTAGDEETYPEGGVEAWLVVLGAWCAMLAGLGLINTIGPIQAHVERNQLVAYSTAEVSWIFSLYVFLVFLCGVQIGPVFDAKGPRWLILSGSVLIVLSLMLLGSCTRMWLLYMLTSEYWHFILAFSIVGGVGSSLLFTPAISAISHFFDRRRATATGLATTGGAVGGVVFPIVFRALVPKVGFAWATRVLGFIFVVLCVVANLFVRSRLPPKPGSRATSVLPDFSIFLDGSGAFALITLSIFFMEFGLFVPIAYLTSYSLANGVDDSFSYQIIAILSAGSFFGRWLPGLWADKWGRFNVMNAMLLLCLVTTFALWLPAKYSGNTVPLLVVYCVLFGFGSGSNISLTPTCIGQICPTTSEYGRWYALCYTFAAIAPLVGIPIAGSLIEAAGGEYYGLIVFTGGSYVVSLSLFVAARVRKAGWSFKVVY